MDFDLFALIDAVKVVVGSFSWDNLTGTSLTQVIVWIALSVIGMVVHFYIDIKKGVISGTLIDYLFKTHLSATIQTVVGLFVAASAWFAVNPPPTNWGALVIAAIISGYTADSVLNKGKTKTTLNK